MFAVGVAEGEIGKGKRSGKKKKTGVEKKQKQEELTMQKKEPYGTFEIMKSDRSMVSWTAFHAKIFPVLNAFLTYNICSLAVPFSI